MFCLLSTGTTALAIESRSPTATVVWQCLACLSGTVTVSAVDSHILALGAVWWCLTCCPQGWWRVQWNVTLRQLRLSGDVLPVVCNDDGAGSGLLYPHSWGCLVMSCLLSAVMTVLGVDCCTLTAGVVWWCLACCLQWWNRMCSGQSFPDGDGYLETRRMRWE